MLTTVKMEDFQFAMMSELIDFYDILSANLDLMYTYFLHSLWIRITNA